MTKLIDKHPLEFLVITALGLLLAWNLRGYLLGQIKVTRFHRRPQEYLPLAALAVEIFKLIFKDC